MSFYTNVAALGNNILFRGVSDDGKRFKDRIEYHPTLYIHTKEETKFRTLEGKPVGAIQPGTMVLALIPYLACSTAIPFIIALMPPLEAE